MPNYTRNTTQMNDAVDNYGEPWKRGTLRVFHDDDRQCWSVCQVGCDNYGTALTSWRYYGGQFFDGEQWKPISEWTRTVLLPANVRHERRPKACEACPRASARWRG